MRARVIKHSAIAACPFTILMMEHYDEKGNCRCTDPSHTGMIVWGYKWNEEEGRWIADETDAE